MTIFLAVMYHAFFCNGFGPHHASRRDPHFNSCVTPYRHFRRRLFWWFGPSLIWWLIYQKLRKITLMRPAHVFDTRVYFSDFRLLKFFWAVPSWKKWPSRTKRDSSWTISQTIDFLANYNSQKEKRRGYVLFWQLVQKPWGNEPIRKLHLNAGDFLN